MKLSLAVLVLALSLVPAGIGLVRPGPQWATMLAAIALQGVAWAFLVSHRRDRERALAEAFEEALADSRLLTDEVATVRWASIPDGEGAPRLAREDGYSTEVGFGAQSADRAPRWMRYADGEWVWPTIPNEDWSKTCALTGRVYRWPGVGS